MELINKKRCVIVGASAIKNDDFLKKNIFYDDYVIAADGGYSRLNKANILPDLIVGDFDSSDYPCENVPIIALNPIKDCTDTEFAVKTAVEKGFREILLLGCIGGRIDHTYANFTLIAAFKQNGINITALDENQKIYAVKDEKHKISANGRYLSVYSFSEKTTVSLSGVFYPLDNYELSYFQSLGTSNEITEPYATVEAKGGTLLVMEVSKSVF